MSVPEWEEDSIYVRGQPSVRSEKPAGDKTQGRVSEPHKSEARVCGLWEPHWGESEPRG